MAEYFPSGNDAFASARGSDNSGGAKSSGMQGTAFGPPSSGGGYAARPSQGTAWGSSLSGLLPWVGGAAGIAGLVGGMFFGKTAAQKDAVSSQSVTEPDPTIDYNQDGQVSGAENTLTYKVTGFSNQVAKWNELNTIFGKKVKIFPVKAMQPYGSGSFIIGCLDLGYGELAMDPADFAMGERPLSDFPGVVTEIQYGRTDDPAFVTPLKASSSENTNIPLGIADGFKTVRIGKAGTQMGGTVNFPYGLWDRNQYFPNVYEAYAVGFIFQYKKTTSNTWVTGASLDVVENTLIPFSRSVAWTITEVGDYDIRVARTTGGENFPYGVYVAGEARAVLTNLYAYFDAPDPPFKDFFDSKGVKVRTSKILYKIPNTVEGASVQDEFSAKPSRKLRHWDGMQWVAPEVSEHPPDIALEILTGQCAALQVEDKNIDLDSFKDWSVFCFNNGLTYNKSIDQGIRTEDLLDEVAACGRANIVNINGKYTAIVDKPRPKVTQHFSQHSIIKNSFTAQASLGKSPQVIYAQFLNPDKDWQQDEIEVYDDGFDVNNKTLERQTILFPGCTNAIEAHKRARYLMACTRLQFWTYTFRTAVSYLACKIGDRVRVTHEAIFAGLGQGRISSLITNDDGDLIAIRIDAPQEIEPDKTYGIKTMSGTTELHFELSNATGETQILTLSEPLSFTADAWPIVGNQVLFGELDFESIDCLITEINPAEDFTAQLTLIPYNEGCYTDYDKPIPAYVSRLSTKKGISKSVGMPTLLSLDSGNAALKSLGAGRFESGILLTLVAESLPIESYETWCKLSSVLDIDTNWKMAFFSAESGQARIDNVIDGELYDVKVRNRRADNYVSAWNYAAINHKVVGQTAKPPDVPQLVQRIAGTKKITWYYDEAHGVIVPPDHAGFVLKMVYTPGPDWEHGLVISARHNGTIYDFDGLVSGLKTIMIKAVDFAGNEQAGPPAFVITDFGGTDSINVVEQVALSPLYEDVIINNHAMTTPTELNLFPIPLTDPWFPANLANEMFTIGHVPGPGGVIGAEAISPDLFPANLNDPLFPANLSDPWTQRTYRDLVAEFSAVVPNSMAYPAALKLVYDLLGAFVIEYRVRETLPLFPANLSDPLFPNNLSNPWLTIENPTWLPYNDSGIPLETKTAYTLVWNTPFFPEPLTNPLFPANLSDPWFSLGTPVYIASEVPGIPEERRWDFRLSGAGGINQAVIKSLGYFWDVPDKTEEINDFIVDDLNGKRLPLTKSFRAIKRTDIAIEGTPEYPNARQWIIEGKASGQPTVKLFDGAGNPALGKIDVLVKGY